MRTNQAFTSSLAVIIEDEINQNLSIPPPHPIFPPLPSLTLPRLPQNHLNHLIPHLIRLREPGFKVFLNLLKLLPIAIEIPQIDARAPVARRKRELEIVGAEGVVGDGGVDGFVEELGRAEEVFGNTEPHARGLLVC
jgi:hypothetical protein